MFLTLRWPHSRLRAATNDMNFDPSQFGATPVAPTPPGFNPAQFNATPAAAANQPAPSLAQSVWSGLAGAGSQIKAAAEGGAAQVQDAASTITKGAPGAEALPVGLDAGLEGESGIASILTSPLAPLFKPITDAISYLGNKISSIPAVQKLALSPTGDKIEAVAKPLADAGNVAGTILGADQVVKAPATIADTAAKIKDAVTPTPPDPLAVKAAADAKTATQLKSVAQDWEKPSAINQPSYKNARAALEKAPGTPQFLAEQGLNPFAHVEDGKYNTEEAAQNLRDTAGKLSNETLRPSLQMADYTTPKTPVTDITQAAIEQAQKTPHITADDAEAIATNIAQKGEALARKYPDGMSLENMHDEKITYAKNGGYSQFKSNADTNAAISNKTMGSALADMVEKKAPPELPVHDFNAYLQKYYQAADYLDALNGKKAPVSTAQNVARFVTKFGTAAIARHLVPGMGDLITSFAGYKIGGALEHAAENLTNPMRDTFLKNLKITNPEAFTKVQAYANSAPK